MTDTSRGIKLRKGDDVNSEGDPHIWHSAPNAIIMLDNIREALSAADAPNADFYRANAAAYTSKLNDLDAYIFAQIATLPPANRKLVSNHDTFGYYSERYGLVFVGSVVPGMDTNFQPTAQNLADLVQAIKTQKVKAIFTETSINPNLARRIAEVNIIGPVRGQLDHEVRIRVVGVDARGWVFEVIVEGQQPAGRVGELEHRIERGIEPPGVDLDGDQVARTAGELKDVPIARPVDAQLAW